MSRIEFDLKRLESYSDEELRECLEKAREGRRLQTSKKSKKTSSRRVSKKREKKPPKEGIAL